MLPTAQTGMWWVTKKMQIQVKKPFPKYDPTTSLLDGIVDWAPVRGYSL